MKGSSGKEVLRGDCFCPFWEIASVLECCHHGDLRAEAMKIGVDVCRGAWVVVRLWGLGHSVLCVSEWAMREGAMRRGSSLSITSCPSLGPRV